MRKLQRRMEKRMPKTPRRVKMQDKLAFMFGVVMALCAPCNCLTAQATPSAVPVCSPSQLVQAGSVLAGAESTHVLPVLHGGLGAALHGALHHVPPQEVALLLPGAPAA